jgi:hypothetical protein
MNVLSVSARPASRQPRSVFERIAVGAALVGAVASWGGVLTLVLVAHFVGLSSALSFLCWLASAAVLVIRPRWAPLASTVLGAGILALFVNQPYAMASLANPAVDYGHFAGDVFALTCAILLTAASAVAAAQALTRPVRKA